MVTRYDVISSRRPSHFWVKRHVVDEIMQSNYLCIILHVKRKKFTILTVFTWFLILDKIQDGHHVWWRHRPPAAPPPIKYTSSWYEDQRLSTKGKIISKYYNISKPPDRCLRLWALKECGEVIHLELIFEPLSRYRRASFSSRVFLFLNHHFCRDIVAAYQELFWEVTLLASLTNQDVYNENKTQNSNRSVPHQMEPPSPLISWVNPFRSRFINRTAYFRRKVSYFRESRLSPWKKWSWMKSNSEACPSTVFLFYYTSIFTILPPLGSGCHGIKVNESPDWDWAITERFSFMGRRL